MGATRAEAEMFMIAAILTGCECVYKSGAVERERSTFSQGTVSSKQRPESI